MSNYPKVNYIGNKANLSKWIIKNLPLKKGIILDLFCGGCSVSYALKEAGYTVYANDILYSNYVLAKAIIENSNVHLDKNEYEIKISKKIIDEIYQKIRFLENKLFYSDEVKELAKLIAISNKLDNYKRYIYLSLLRRAMIRKIPYSRMNVPWNQIVKLRDEEYSYKKYKRRRAYHNKSFLFHINNNLDNYNYAVFDNKKRNIAFNSDSFEMIDKLKKKVDMIYLDPPYPATMNKYDEFYGSYDIMFNHQKKFVNFSKNNMFVKNMEKLIKKCINKTKYVIISENTNTRPSVKELSLMLKKYGTVSTREKKHQYKFTGKDKKNKSSEILIILKMKTV